MDTNKIILPVLLLIAAVILFSIFVNLNQPGQIITGRQASDITPSQAQIEETVAIELRNNLDPTVTGNGIRWVTPALSVNTLDNPADDNNNVTELTDYVIGVMANVRTDICAQANQSLKDTPTGATIPQRDGDPIVDTSVGYVFAAGLVNADDALPYDRNVSYLNESVPIPIQTDSTPWARTTPEERLPGVAVLPGSEQYHRYWLDVPATQLAGTYNNEITFKAVKDTNSCV